MLPKHSSLIIAIIIFIIVFAIYLSTLLPTVTWGDSGEFITVAYTLGIGHPTCYPVYTLLGKLFTTLIPFGNIGWRLNLLSALAGAASVAILYLFLLDLLSILFGSTTPSQPREPDIENQKSEVRGQKSDKNSFISDFGFRISDLIAVSGSLLFGFSLTFWQYAVIAEVHTLQILLTVSLFYLWLKWWKTGELRFFYTSALVYGLMLAHHYLSILLIPAFLFLIISTKYKVQSTKLKPLLITVLLILLGWSSYLYLPIRASQFPVINWNAPNTFSGFFNCLSGGQFKLRMFSTSPGLGMESSGMYLIILNRNFTRFISLLAQQIIPNSLPLGIVSVWLVVLIRTSAGLLSLVGLIRLYLTSRFWFGFSLIVVIITLGAGLNYQIADIEPYYLGIYLILLIWISFGLYTLCSALKKWLPQLTILPVLLPVIFALIPLLSLYGTVNRRTDYPAYYYARNILQTVEPTTMILTGGDNDIFPLWYGKYIERINPQVIIFGSNFLTSPWYKEFFRANPEFKIKLADRLYLSRDAWVEGLIQNIIEPNELNHPVYLTFYDDYLAQQRAVIPVGNFIPDWRYIKENQFLAEGTLYKLIKPEEIKRIIQSPKLKMQNADTYVAKFDETIYLRQCLIENQVPLKSGDVFTVTFFWEVDKKSDKDYRGFITLPTVAGQVYTLDGKVLFQYKFSPVYSLVSTSSWEPGKIYTETYHLMIPLNLPADEYQLTLSMLDEKGYVRAILPNQKESTPFVICGKIIVTEKQ